MKKWIAVTEYNGNKFLVNTDMIVYICKTCIRLVDNTNLQINEDVFNKILEGYEKYSTR